MVNKKILVRRLAEAYPNPKTELQFSGEYQLVCSVLLSAQCTDKKVNETTPELFRRFPDFAALAKAKLPSLEQIIRPINYYKSKAKHLVGMAQMVQGEFAGKLPKTHAELIRLPGVGRKTANVVMGELGHAPAFPVDTHVFRVSKRLGLAQGKNPEEVEKELCSKFDPKLWRNLHHWLILHGRRICQARNPKCSECTLRASCPKNF